MSDIRKKFEEMVESIGSLDSGQLAGSLSSQVKELELQKFFRNGGTIQDLDTVYGVDTTAHGKYPNLLLFKYNQITCNYNNKIVRESRGIILDSDDDYNIVARPFDKFFNYAEGFADPIDWNDATIYEKIDGSIMCLYHYDNAWHVSSSGTPNAGRNVNGFDFTFADLFWKTFNKYHVNLPNPDCDFCFMFELTSPYNKVVVKHMTESLTLIGARHLLTQEEVSVDVASKFLPRIPVVKSFKMKDLNEVLNCLPDLDPLSQEGYVVCNNSQVNSNGNFNRIKIKSPKYVALHHLRDGLNSKKNLTQIVRTGEISEIIAHFPEFNVILTDIKAKYDDLISEIEKDYQEIKDIELQKEFALKAMNKRTKSALFTLRNGQAKSIPDYLKSIHIDSFMSLMEKK